MNTGIKIEYKYPHQSMMKGIYKITFGWKFYIGKAKMLCKRKYQHEIGINGCLKRFAMPRKEHSHYWRIGRYLHENPAITTGYIEIIQRCISEMDLFNMENIALNDAKWNKDCLNGAFYNTSSRLGDSTLWDAVVIDNIVYYFDQNNPEEKISHLTKLTAAGNIWKRKSKSVV